MIHLGPEPRGPQTVGDFVLRLLAADWESPAGPIRLCPDVTLSDLRDAVFFQNARVLLAALAAENGTRATAVGNLNRVFIQQLFPTLVLSEPYRISIQRTCKTLKEQDVWPLHLARVVAECAGLIIRRKRRFQLTKSARAMLPDDQAGVLYRRLFLAYFRRFDLRYSFNLRDVPGIQQTMAVILWRLDTVVRDWAPVRELAPQVLLPGVLAQLQATMTYPFDAEEWILTGYVLTPLATLGLIEQKTRSDWPHVTDNDHIRTTALWRKFIRFDTGGRGAS